MAIYNLGSINRDLVYALPHLPVPGETLASSSLDRGLGGKGANQSVAIAKAGAKVVHIGAIGSDGADLSQQLEDFGVSTDHISVLDMPTGHAVIYVDGSAENVIVLFEGANGALKIDMLETALADAQPDDWLLAQNETNLVPEAVALARERELKIAIAAAPFDPAAVEPLLDHVDLVAVNQIEAAQLAESLPHRTKQLSDIQQLVTLGAQGAEVRHNGNVERVEAFAVEPVDTTGAGDTFLGFYLASISGGASTVDALTTASAASAIQVTRRGASAAIPDIAEVQTFIAKRGEAS
ncbi:MAG: ribokinase [Pseudomonadota bacterium]